MTPVAVLDTGGLAAWSERRPSRQVTALMEVFRRTRSSLVVVPGIVLVEALQDSPRDAAVNRLLAHVFVETDLPVVRARRAAALRQQTSGSAVDAVVAATAEHHDAAAVLTSDPGDLSALLERADCDAVVVAV